MGNIKNNRIVGLDIIKTIAIIFVIMRHIPLIDFNIVESMGEHWYLQLLVNLATCGVPLFFAVDGYLLLSKKEFDINKYIKKLIKIVVLYFVWSFILIIINLLFDHTTIDRFILLDLILKLNDTSLYTSELWFLETLFAIYLIYPLLWQVFNKEEKMFNILLVVLLFFTIVPNVIDILASFLNNQYHIMYLTKLNELINNFNIFNYSWHLLFFLIGGIIYKNKDLIIKHRIKLLIFGVISLSLSFVYSYAVANRNIFLENYNDKSLFEVLIVIALFALLLNTNIGNKLSIVGANTFGIYVTHQFVIRIVRLFIDQNSFGLRLVSVFIVLIISLIVSILLSKIPFLKKLTKI